MKKLIGSTVTRSLRGRSSESPAVVREVLYVRHGWGQGTLWQPCSACGTGGRITR
jgi:hypothetical protein